MRQARNSEFKHEEEQHHSVFFVSSCICLFVCAAVLGTIRLYGLYLEHRISETTHKIEECRERNADLSREYSQMLTPARIYTYARNNLGMENAENIRCIKVRMAEIAAVSPKKVRAAKDKGFLANMNPFVDTAHAED
ncbi:MAG: hypothetical protein Q4E17_00740 [Synergistes sp.]|nr:hypothetical protein [Synergistes sp.]